MTTEAVRGTACEERARVDRHFEGEISPQSERAMRAHLPGCSSCRAHYERWLLLAQIDPGVPSAETRIGRGLGFGGSEAGARSVSAIAVRGAAFLAAAASLVLILRSGADDTDAFHPRGAAPRPPASRVFVYDVRPGQAPVLASGSLHRGDELAFAYENGAAKSHLLVFGVDEHAHVYWFYPAWLAKEDNPVAIPIAHDARRHELPEAVKHDFDGSHLEIRAVFLDGPIDVSRVEAMIQTDPARRLPIPGAVEFPSSFVVSP